MSSSFFSLFSRKTAALAIIKIVYLFSAAISVTRRSTFHFSFFQHNMSTAVDKDAIRAAYEDVRADTSDTEW